MHLDPRMHLMSSRGRSPVRSYDMSGDVIMEDIHDEAIIHDIANDLVVEREGLKSDRKKQDFDVCKRKEE